MIKSESVPQIESKEKLKTKIVNLDWGTHEDQGHAILEMPVDWDLMQLIEDFKKERGFNDMIDRGYDFYNWLVDRGAKETDKVDNFYIENS